MAKGKTKIVSSKEAPGGNYICEWFGNRIFPEVRLDMEQFSEERFGVCPFLSDALRQATRCVKNTNSLGVCTINTASNGTSRDWLACPYRVISSNLVRIACERIFSLATEQIPQPIPATLLADPEVRKLFTDEVAARGVGYAFFQDKLGGEISVIATSKSPELSFDVTLVEVLPNNDGFHIGRYGILEIQTMDFHGSYKRAVDNLRDARRLHATTFPEALKANIKWAADGIEGPNIANVFKRTFYQILLKFQLSGKGAAAGTVLALPKSVWDSWQPFLGAPELTKVGKTTYEIKPVDDRHGTSDPTNAHICVFDLDSSAESSISPVKVTMHIRVDAEELSHHAFKVVPAGMLKSLSESDSILVRIKERLANYWPELK